MRVIWSPLAKRDLSQVLAERAKVGINAASVLYDRIYTRVNQLREFPYLGPPSHRRPNLRQLTITRTPFIVFYRITEREVRIIALIHAAQSD